MKTFLFPAAALCAVALAGCAEKAVDKPAEKASLERAPDKPETEVAALVAEKKPTANIQQGQPKVAFLPELKAYVDSILPLIATVPDDRKQNLKKLASFVETKLKAGEPAKLLFICTHNSRRSHMAQLWAATAAAYYGLEGVETFSGGTEATAFNPRAVAAMERAGFQIEKPEGKNPHYKVTLANGVPAQDCFSKKYSDAFNPKDNFAAVMTCSKADKSCPFVEGAALRIATPYIDPKESDGTPEEAATYDARAKQIATEMFYLFSQVRTS